MGNFYYSGMATQVFLKGSEVLYQKNQEWSLYINFFTGPCGRAWTNIYISVLWRLNMKWLHESSAVYQIYFDHRVCREGTRENLKLHIYHISFRWCEWLVVKLFPWRRFSHYSEKWSTLKYIFGWRYRSISTIALSLNCK